MSISLITRGMISEVGSETIVLGDTVILAAVAQTNDIEVNTQTNEVSSYEQIDDVVPSTPKVTVRAYNDVVRIKTGC